MKSYNVEHISIQKWFPTAKITFSDGLFGEDIPEKKISPHEWRDVPKDMLGQPGACCAQDVGRSWGARQEYKDISDTGHPVGFHPLAGSS